MKIRFPFFLLLMALTWSWQGCSKDSKNKEQDSEKDNSEISISSSDENGNNVDIHIDADSPEEAAIKALEALNKNSGQVKEVVAYQSLKDLLPDNLIGLKRTSIKGQKAGVAGFNISTANAEYEAGDKNINVNIADAGGAALALAGLAVWANVDIEEESDDGYQRTTKIDGHKAFESYDKSSKSGQVAVLVNNRFVVTLDGSNVADGDLRKALNKIDLQRLSNLQ